MKKVKVCPDCGEAIYWDNYYSLYKHKDINKCAYMEDIKGNRYWDNELIASLAEEQASHTSQIENPIDTSVENEISL